MSGRNKGGRATHNNTYAFRHNPNSKKTEKILNSPNEGVCHECWDMIEWRKKYRKYKPLTVARRCDACHQKTVRLAYHTMCQPCAEERGKCAKCGKEPMTHPYLVLGAPSKEDEERVALMKMTERQRRTYFRELEREQGGRKKKKGDDDSDVDLSGDDDDDDELGDMPAPPPSKFDPDMLVKERAARAGVKLDENNNGGKESSDEEDEDEDDLDGSAESYEDDSDEIDRVDADAEKLVGTKDDYTKQDGNEEDEEDDEDAGSEDDAGSDDEE